MKTLSSLKAEIERRLEEIKPALRPLVAESLESVNAAIGSSWRLKESNNVRFVFSEGCPYELTAWEAEDEHGNDEKIVYQVEERHNSFGERVLEVFFWISNDMLSLGFPNGKLTTIDKATVRLFERDGRSYTHTQSCDNYLFVDEEGASERDRKIRQIFTCLTPHTWGAVENVFESLPEYSLLFNVSALEAWNKKQAEWYEENDQHEWYDYAKMSVEGRTITFVTPTSDRVIKVDTAEKKLSVYFPRRGSVTAAGLIANNLDNQEAVFTTVTGEEITSEMVSTYIDQED
ncbi:hypothetical protein EHV15_35965 [Paenibacillus oralis]|uniref:Uncharacterized protein n=1 Tax=Paenibacillus oralis TaxID=2490856 RepID=A0A3P3TCX1_9BACL|nr:hypothetical protein [Paenibacillus oralis]RRJ54968.1 hypothetical protein EHV15_35965 [Paenibacillus oralis]